MLANIFMDLLCIVGIVFLGSLFVVIVMNTINEIKINRAKNKSFKVFENIAVDMFKKQLEEQFEIENKDRDK